MSKYQIRYQHTAWDSADTIAIAKRSVRRAGGCSKLYYADCPDGLYCYRSAADKRDDDTGASAFAVICGPGQQHD